VRVIIAKLVASTADSLWKSERRKYSQERSRSRNSQGNIFDTPGLEIASVHASAFEGEFANGSQTYAGTGTLRYAW
jgi:hypothetical protein